MERVIKRCLKTYNPAEIHRVSRGALMASYKRYTFLDVAKAREINLNYSSRKLE